MDNMVMNSSWIYDGMLHWCFLISIFGFCAAMIWTLVRVLLPLRRLLKQAESIMDGILPTFETSVGGIREIDRLRRSLGCMIRQIQIAKELEAVYRKALTESQENERKRIAQDIHDDTIQSMVLVSHSIERATKAQDNDDHSALASNLEKARHQLLCAVENLRKIIADLRPTILDELGLATAIEVLCENRPILEFRVAGESYGIDHAQELAIFRAAQELTRNAELYSNAKKISVSLRYSNAAIVLEVRDDGIGFEIPEPLQSLAAHGHYGLLGIYERIMHLGGKVSLMSQPQRGTCITVTIPVMKPSIPRTASMIKHAHATAFR